MRFSAVLPAQSAGGSTSVTMAGVYFPEQGQSDTIDAIYFTAPSAITGTNTNYFTVNVRQLRAGSVLATLATKAFTSGTNAAAETPVSLPTPASPVVLEAGDVVDVQLVQTGTGLAVPAGCLVTVVVS